jgi:CheY-like chemotaxis protein
MDDTKKILIVEDETKVAFFLQESLESADHSYRVVSVASGEDALNAMESASFDLVISDLRMPGISGLELLQHIRETNPATQTILITAYGSDQVEAETHHLQAYRYFTKPFPIEDFTDAVKAALDAGIPASRHMERITQRLSDLRYEVGAQCILLSDHAGRILTEVGFSDQARPNQIVALMSDGFIRANEITAHLREERSFNLHYHEGTRYDIYTSNVGPRLFITLIFDRRQGASRVGMVWLYAKRAVQDLLRLVASDGWLLPSETRLGDYGAGIEGSVFGMA